MTACDGLTPRPGTAQVVTVGAGYPVVGKDEVLARVTDDVGTHGSECSV